MLADELSEEWLVSTCKIQDLTSLCSLDLQVDSALQSIDALGFFLPNLRHLKLSGSNVPCIRDLGTSLRQLEVLWMRQCNLQDLSGIGAIPSLQEFYLPFNHVSDLSPLVSNDAIAVLDLEGNSVQSLEEIQMLGMCSVLSELTLIGNPVVNVTGFSRSAVLLICPVLEMLNDEPVDKGPDTTSSGSDGREKAESSANNVTTVSDGIGAPVGLEQLSSSHPLLSQALNNYYRGHMDFSPSRGEPTEATLVLERLKLAQPKHALTSVRESLAEESHDVVDARGMVRPHTVDSSELAAPRWPALDTARPRCIEDSSSELTCGDALFGSPLAAVRQRRRMARTDLSSVDVDIRELLRQYQTFTQTGCLQAEELEALKAEASQRRLRTPDVRIHVDRASRCSSRPSSALGFGCDHNQFVDRLGRTSTAERVRLSAEVTKGSSTVESLHSKHDPVLMSASADSILPVRSEETALSMTSPVNVEERGNRVSGYPSGCLRPDQVSACWQTDHPPLAPSLAGAGRRPESRSRISHSVPIAPAEHLRGEKMGSPNNVVRTTRAKRVYPGNPGVCEAVCPKHAACRDKLGDPCKDFKTTSLAPALPCAARSLSCCSHSPLAARSLRRIGSSCSPRAANDPCIAVC